MACEALREWIQTKTLPDVEEAIDTLFEAIAAAKKAEPQDKEAYEEMRSLRMELTRLLDELADGTLEAAECEEILLALREMALEE